MGPLHDLAYNIRTLYPGTGTERDLCAPEYQDTWNPSDAQRRSWHVSWRVATGDKDYFPHASASIVYPNNEFEMRWCAANNGNANVSTPTRVQFFFSADHVIDTADYQAEYITLTSAPAHTGQCYTHTLHVPNIPQEEKGEYDVGWWVDYQNVVSEPDDPPTGQPNRSNNRGISRKPLQVWPQES